MKNQIKECMGGVATDGDVATAEFVFPETFKGFHGHFPDNPILPGVCLVQCALLLAAEVSGRALQVKVIKSAKFVATVSPGQPLQAECKMDGDRVTASFASGETRIASLKLEVSDA